VADAWQAEGLIAGMHCSRGPAVRARRRSFGLITVGVDMTEFSATISPELAEARRERRAGGAIATPSERDSPRCARLRP
jgi:hypothetical protein